MWVLWEVLPQQWMEADHGPVIKSRRQASGGKGQHPTIRRCVCTLIDSAAASCGHAIVGGLQTGGLAELEASAARTAWESGIADEEDCFDG